MSKIVVIANSKSGRALEVEQVRQRLGGQHISWLDLAAVDDLASRIESEALHRSDTVVAAGGDGTVNATVNALMSLNSARRPNLGIIPLGTANDFAATIGVPDHVDQAVDLLDLPPKRIDVAMISGNKERRYYANMAAGGNCVRVSEAMTDDIKARWGAFSYMRGAVDVLPDMKTFRVTAVCDREIFEDIETWAILVANGRTNAGRIEVAPEASPADGLLDIIIIRDGTMGDMVEILAKNLLGNFLDSEQVIFRQAKSLTLQSNPGMRFTIDGEVVDEEPVHFEAIPAAIAVHGNMSF